MAFPTIVATARWEAGGVAVTPHYARMPAGIIAGDLLLVFHAQANTGRTIDPKWTVLSLAAGGATFVGNNPAEVAYAIATGAETGDLVFNALATARIGGTFTYVIRGYAGAPVDAGAWVQTAAVTAVDPPALTPPTGLAEYLWLVFATTSTGNPGRIATPPAGFGGLLQDSGNMIGVNLSMAGMYRTLAAATLDPAPVVWSGAADDAQAITVAVRGIPAGPPPRSFAVIV